MAFLLVISVSQAFAIETDIGYDTLSKTPIEYYNAIVVNDENGWKICNVTTNDPWENDNKDESIVVTNELKFGDVEERIL